MAVKQYRITELPAEVRKKVIENNRCCSVSDSDWWSAEFEDFTERLTEEGFSLPEISFSGFSSQGDGASFTSKSVNLLTFLKTGGRYKPEFRLLEVGLNLGGWIDVEVIRTDHHYSHERTVSVRLEPRLGCDGLLGERLEKMLDGVLELLKVRVLELSREIYRALERRYDYLTSNAGITETLNDTGRRFTRKGDEV